MSAGILDKRCGVLQRDGYAIRCLLRSKARFVMAHYLLPVLRNARSLRLRPEVLEFS
jgi:hypothetical protein